MKLTWTLFTCIANTIPQLIIIMLFHRQIELLSFKRSDQRRNTIFCLEIGEMTFSWAN